MKKIAVIILVLSLMAGLMSGCVFRKVSIEEDIINMQIGGYLYTSQARAGTRAERNYLKERKASVDEMMKHLEKAAGYSFSVTKGLGKYRDNLIKYIKKLPDSDSDTVTIASSILKRITAYETLQHAYEEQLRQLMAMKTESPATEAVINTYIWSSVCSIVNSQNEYLEWMVTNTGTICSMLGEINDRISSRFLSSSSSIYEKNIYTNLEKMLTEYETASVCNAMIESADYYASQYYQMIFIDNIVTILADGLADGDVLSDLNAAYENALTTVKRPAVFIPAPDKVSFTLTRRVLADDGTEMLYEAASVLHQEADEIMEKPRLMFPADSFDDRVKEEAGTNSTHESRLKAVNQQTTESNDISNYADNAEKAAQQQADNRTKMILLIKIGQKILQVKNLNPFATTEDLYMSTVTQITRLMTSSVPPPLTDKEKEDMTPEEIKKREDEISKIQEQIRETTSFVQSELISLVGENFNQFMQVILNESAENLYNTFMNWKDDIGALAGHEFTRDELADLLIRMGIEVIIDEDKADAAVPSPTPAATSESSPSPPASTPDSSPGNLEPVTSSEPEDPGEFDVFHIMASHDSMRRMDAFSDNETLLFNIYGWTDPLDYGELIRSEGTDSNGNPKQIGYHRADDDETPVGWYVYISGDYLEYRYYFPDDKTREMTIKRKGTLESSFVTNIDTEDTIIDRETHIRFREPGEGDEYEKISYIRENQNNEKDGLNTTSYNSAPTYELWSEGRKISSYTYKDGVMIREVQNEHSGESVYSETSLYYPNGWPKIRYTELNGEYEGLYTSYHDNGELSVEIEYRNGVYDGRYEMFFDDGTRWRFKTYKDGKLNGPAEEYFSDEGHPIHYRAEYLDNELHGIYEAFNRDGNPTVYIEYKNGLMDGEYKEFATGSSTAESIHAFGQYSNGKKTGEWLYGYNNEGWIQKVYYTDDIKVWDEKTDSSIRTYYNPDGSVSHTEEKP